jgi:hypothetical protein
MKDTFIALWPNCHKKARKDDCLRIPPYDHGHYNEIIVVKIVEIYILSNKEVNFIVVKIVLIKTKEIL